MKTAERDRRDIFVPGIGQYENIGDIILRRQLLRWLRPLGRLHVYVGRAPAGYAEGLGLGPDDLVYQSFLAWYRAGLGCALRGTASYFFKPGEIQLSLPGLKEHLAMVPLAVLIRLRGGVVIRAGAGSRNFAWLPRLLMWPSLAVAQRTWWRDPATAAYLGGDVMPDLAFGEGDDPVDTTSSRDLLVISMRGDRRGVPGAWIEALRAFAARHGLTVCAVTQVERDAQLSRELATALGGTCVDWTGFAHDTKEAELNAIYRRTRMTVSDRLHVLIASYTHGAIPVALQTDASTKIARHFQAIGIDGMGVDASMLAPANIEAVLEEALRRGSEVLAALPEARARLASVRRAITERVSAG